MFVARFSWVPNLYNLHFLLENHRPQPDPVNSYRDVMLMMMMMMMMMMMARMVMITVRMMMMVI